MTDTITTIPEALEAAAEAIADELVGTIYLSKLTQCQAAIRALSARIAAPVAVVKPHVCAECNGRSFADIAYSGGWRCIECKKEYLTIQPAAQAVAEAVAKVTAERDELQRDVDYAGKKILHMVQRERGAVAGAYLAAAEVAIDNQDCTPWEIQAAILALTDADATAALARRDAEVRKAALREAASIAFNACLVPPDGGSPTEAERLVCEEAGNRILALIDKEPAHG